MLFRVLLAVGGATTLLAAPALKTPGPNVLYFPTTIGATWVYECPDDTVESATVSAVEKSGDDLIVSRTGVDGTRTIYAKMIVSPDGLRQERELTDGKVGWVLQAKLAAGSTWDMPEGGKRRVFGPEEVSVPAGKFKALRVDWEQAGSKYSSWYAVGIGEVKRTETRGGIVSVRRALKSFQLKDDKK